MSGMWVSNMIYRKIIWKTTKKLQTRNEKFVTKHVSMFMLCLYVEEVQWSKNL